MKKEFILILGMHRSATSLTAMLLQNMGFYLGEEDELIKAHEDNKKGFFEFEKAVSLNDQILLENNMTWAFLNDKMEYSTKLTSEIQKIVCHLIKNSNGRAIALKDPRMCLLEPLWKKEINIARYHEKTVVVFRHPYEVALSIQKRDQFNYCYSLKIWYLYNYSILYNISSYPEEDVIFLLHDEYFTHGEKQIKRLLQFFHLPAEDASKYLNSVDHSLRHHAIEKTKTQDSADIMTMCLELYDLFVSLANNQITLKDIPMLKLKKNFNAMISNSYLESQCDTEQFAFRTSNGYTIKQWCMYQLDHYSDLITKELHQLIESQNINRMYIYGNGSLSKSFYKILDGLEEKIMGIYDQESTETIIIGKKNYKVSKLKDQKYDNDSYIINTVLFYEEDIINMLKNHFPKDNIISLYGFFYNLLRVGMNHQKNPMQNSHRIT